MSVPGLPGLPDPAILIIDDDEIDVLAMQRAFAHVKLALPVTVAWDGAEAIDRLEEMARAPGQRRPVIALLDLNMPRMTGFEFLARSEHLDLPLALTIFVMSTSNRPSDIARAHRHKIAGYVVKSTELDFARDFARMLKLYVKLTAMPVMPPTRGAA